MALNWFVNSACTIVFGYAAEASPSGKQAQGVAAKSLESTMEMVSPLVETCREKCPIAFQMPLHYPRYAKKDYEKMEEWKVDMLLKEYGLSFNGTLEEKRQFAMGAFLWPDQL